MISNQKISLVIPTLNEAEGIAQTLELTPACVDEIVIVDGNSKDGTREIAANWEKEKNRNVIVINEVRKGYGRAFKTGFEHSTGSIIVTGDGDGTYPIELTEEIVNHLLSHKLEFVSCNRLPLEDKGSMQSRNLIGNTLMSMAATTLWAHQFKDVLSGMWVFRKSVLKELNLHSDSWNFSEEIKIEAYSKFKDKFAEYKIPYRERLGNTKLVPWKVGIQNICYMLAMRTGSVSLLQKTFKKKLSTFS